MMYAYCDEHDIPYKMCGKLIVATREEELPRLDALWDRIVFSTIVIFITLVEVTFNVTVPLPSCAVLESISYRKINQSNRKWL